MCSGLIIGYDPGGNGNHGIAKLEVNKGKATGLSTSTENSAEDIVLILDKASSLLAIGVDTLTCWCTGKSGFRPADRWLRKKYTKIEHSIISPNGLRGSMVLNGMVVVLSAKKKFSNIKVTETHPKVLYWHLTEDKYDYDKKKEKMDNELSSRLGNFEISIQTEHEWDAAISAFAAFEGITKRWTHDLHNESTENNERLVEPCGKTHYWWPD